MLSGACTQHHRVKWLLLAEHPSLKVVFAVGTLMVFFFFNGERTEDECLSSSCSAYGFVTSLFTPMTGSGVLGVLPLLPLTPLPTPCTSLLSQGARCCWDLLRSMSPFLYSSPRKAVCWLPLWSCSLPKGLHTESQQQAIWRPMEAEGHALSHFWHILHEPVCVWGGSARGEGNSIVFYWQEGHQIELWLMVLHSLGLFVRRFDICKSFV